jgi:hypothetical protein
MAKSTITQGPVFLDNTVKALFLSFPEKILSNRIKLEEKKKASANLGTNHIKTIRDSLKATLFNLPSKAEFVFQDAVTLEINSLK